MPGYSLRTEGRRAAGEELSKRQERAHRILDAAAELIQRWGYRKTAVDDIARAAGVAKGTIYLHWKTREDLFVTLLLREGVEAFKDVVARIEGDPAGIYLSNIVKHVIYVIMTRPLARALFIRDVNVLGELLQQGREDLDMITQQKLVNGRQLLEFFRSRGALRTDRGLEEQLQIYSTLVMGTMVVNQYMPPEMQSSPEEATERLAAMIRDTLEPAEPIAPVVLDELKVAWDQFVQRVMDIVDARLQEEIA